MSCPSVGNRYGSEEVAERVATACGEHYTVKALACRYNNRWGETFCSSYMVVEKKPEQLASPQRWSFLRWIASL